MNKHTQGPWQVNKKVSTSVEQVIAGQGINLIAQCDDVDGVRSREEDQANALLIAAAPELLEACRVVKELLEYRQDAFEFAGSINLLHAVLKKAKGE